MRFQFGLKTLLLAMVLTGMAVQFMQVLGVGGLVLILYVATVAVVARNLHRRFVFSGMLLAVLMALSPLVGVGSGTLHVPALGVTLPKEAATSQGEFILRFLQPVAEFPSRLLSGFSTSLYDVTIAGSTVMVRRSAIMWSWLLTLLGLVVSEMLRKARPSKSQASNNGNGPSTSI